MRFVLLVLAFTALVGATGCEQSGQKRTAQGSIQLPGERAAMNATLNRPPDERAAPEGIDNDDRSIQAAYRSTP